MSVGGGWRGPEQSYGGLSRTFGLRNRDGGDAPSRPIDRALARRALALLRPYRRHALAVLLCIAAGAALGVLPPLAVRGILDDAIPRRDPRLLFLLVGAVVGINVLSGLVGVAQNYVSALAAEGLLADLRRRLFAHLQRLSLAYYATHRSGEIVSRVQNDVGAVQGAVTSTLVAIASNALTVIATVAVIVGMNGRLALLAIVVVPGLYLPTRLVGKVRRTLAKQAQETQADMAAFLAERLHVGGIQVTHLFGQAPADARRFDALADRVRDLNLRQTLAGRWLFMALSVFSVAGPALVYATGGLEAIAGRLSVGSVIAIVAYLANLYRPLANLANVYVDIQGALAVFERIFDVLDTEPEVADRPGAQTAPERGAIRFEGVGFAYPGGEEGREPALSGVSFTIEAGQRVALVGPSGAGKTTVTTLLPRFYDPAEGRVTYGGIDLRDLRLESLRARIGVVTQETFLFHATIRENLLYARPDATDAQIEAAARAANIHDFVVGLPDGYATVVGERALRLSGGERQRLAIARALLKDPEVLVLDEATSNLDATSEYLVRQAFETLLRGRTSLIVAHRLSTILTCDRILVLEKGRLVESGTHDALLARGGLYATLYRRQFKGVDPDA